MEYGTEINNIEDIECLEPDEFTAKRCRLARRQAVQSKKLCAKEERNASIKKVNKQFGPVFTSLRSPRIHIPVFHCLQTITKNTCFVYL